MAVPKRKQSKRKRRQRQASHRIRLTPTKSCPNCGQPHRAHRVCPACGWYKGRQVLTIRPA